jgi:hypothetical protein
MDNMLKILKVKIFYTRKSLLWLIKDISEVVIMVEDCFAVEVNISKKIFILYPTGEII